MDRLPTEVLDNIVSYISSPGTLVALRLVDKACSRSASKKLFRSVELGVGHKPAITPKSEALAASDYALLVREINFNPQPSWMEEILPPKTLFAKSAVSRLSAVLKNFSRLESVMIYSIDYPIDCEPTAQWPSVVLRAIASLQYHSVKRLAMSIDDTAYLTGCIKDRQEKPVTEFIRQIQHLSLYRTHKKENVMDDLQLILKTATNLVSLKVSGHCSVFNPDVRTFDFRRPLLLKTLSLTCVSITSYNLLGLLEWCKGTISSVTISFLDLDAGSWLHILIQIKKNLKLLKFFFHGWDVSCAKEMEFSDGIWRSRERSQRDHKLIGCAIGDLQRQTNTYRVAEGLQPLSKETYRELDLPTLDSEIDEAWYAELVSRSWDAQKDDTYHHWA